MIELEIQALSERREGLLIEVGRIIVASGYVLQRQRLAQDPHGTLLTMVVRGPPRKQRALEEALGGHERIISFDIAPFEEGESRPHFAASRTTAYIAPPAPPPEPAPEPVVAVTRPKAPIQQVVPVAARPFDEVRDIAIKASAPAVPEPTPEPTPARAPAPPPAAEAEPEFQFLAGPPAHAAAPPPTVDVNPFVEVIPLGPDLPAVTKVLRELDDAYPHIVPHVLELDRSVEEGARESSLALTGQRIGAWVFQQDHASSAPLGLLEAIENIGVPALSDLVEVEQQGTQLHIRNSPLCTQDGHSGCKFFSGYLEGLLGPVVGSTVSIFEVGCRSWGAGECVLAVSD